MTSRLTRTSESLEYNIEVAVVAHELRSPCLSVVGESPLALRASRGFVSPCAKFRQAKNSRSSLLRSFPSGLSGHLAAVFALTKLTALGEEVAEVGTSAI